MRLKDLQALMTRTLIASDSSGANKALEPLAGWIESPETIALAPADRLSIYRNNSRAVRAAALQEVYPAVLALVGEEFFEAAARRYARENPARSGDLNQYGESFPDFLSGLPGLLDQTPYLVDVARYEWMYAEVRHSAAQAGQSAMRLLESAYPLDRIVAACFDENPGILELPNSARFRFLLFRDGEEVRSQVVDRELFDRLSQL